MWFKSNVTIPAVAAISSCLIAATTPAYADLGDQLFKLLAKDGAVGDFFGDSVAISGETAIVGAWRDEDNGTWSGSAYLFDVSDPKNPVQITKLLPDDGATLNRFGWSVAISGATAIVGALYNENNGHNSGSAYLFDTTTGRQLFKLLAKDGAAGDQFGTSVAISGTTAIVGADVDEDNGHNSGSAYLFDTTTGRQLFKLLPENGVADALFGRSVAISGATAIVGASGHGDNGTDSGTVYIFDISDPANPTQLFKLLADDGAQADEFGFSVAISGAAAIVGARKPASTGSAYLFDTTTGRQLFKLLAKDGAAGDNFGQSVGISGATAIVGAHRDDDNGDISGSAYLFDTTTGRQLFKLLPDDGAESDTFGTSVAISGATALVGASGHGDNGTDSGSSYLFDASSCPWDLDDNGDVGVKDLLFLLGAWGPKPGHPADFDDSGDVGVKDLLVLLGNWGPCP